MPSIDSERESSPTRPCYLHVHAHIHISMSDPNKLLYRQRAGHQEWLAKQRNYEKFKDNINRL